MKILTTLLLLTVVACTVVTKPDYSEELSTELLGVYIDQSGQNEYQLKEIDDDTLWGGEYKQYDSLGNLYCVGEFDFVPITDSTPNFKIIPTENRTGNWTFYYSTSAVMLEGKYDSGDRVGEWVYRSEDSSYVVTIPEENGGVSDSSGQFIPVETHITHTYIEVFTNDSTDTVFVNSGYPYQYPFIKWTDTTINVFYYESDHVDINEIKISPPLPNTGILLFPVTIYDTVNVNYGTDPQTSFIDTIDVYACPFDTTEFIAEIEKIQNNTRGGGHFVYGGQIEVVNHPEWFTLEYTGIKGDSSSYSISYDISDTTSIVMKTISLGTPFDEAYRYIDYNWHIDDLSNLTNDWEIIVTNRFDHIDTLKFSTTIQE